MWLSGCLLGTCRARSRGEGRIGEKVEIGSKEEDWKRGRGMEKKERWKRRGEKNGRDEGREMKQRKREG